MNIKLIFMRWVLNFKMSLRLRLSDVHIWDLSYFSLHNTICRNKCIDLNVQFIQTIHDFEVKLREKFWSSDLSSTKQLNWHEIF